VRAILVDRLELGVGVEWLSWIARALDRSKKVVTVFSPDYFESKPCQDELNTALLRDWSLSRTRRRDCLDRSQAKRARR
jgi:TIR domain